MKNLIATIKTAKDMAHTRDDETGAHIDRMSHFVRLIALKLTAKYQFSDEYIEQLFMFSPLHDIGKIGIPDKILFKPDKLDAQEFEVMKKHTTLGREIIDRMLKNFSLDELSSVNILRNIAELHHESVNGHGYPRGLKCDQIPIESRIVAVADVFDALTSQRPYKQAWSNEEALSMLNRLSGIKLDADCVAALENSHKEVRQIQQQFQEHPTG